jgi:23S rRNA (cytosine1962-C5)-methyltransferase
MPKSAVVDAGATVEVSARGAARLKKGHAWVYRSDVASAKGVPAGAMVRVTDARGKFLGTALYSNSSQIAVRMISRDPVPDLPALVAERVRAAARYRKDIVGDSNAYRLIFSEADFLPGLIVDRYDDVLSLQILTQATDAEPVRAALITALVEAIEPAGIMERVDPRIRELEQLRVRKSGLLWGTKSSTVVTMNGGVRFQYDGMEGQKTGAFLDQRENYAAVTRYAHGDALDVFCYQGGFALHMAAKCAKVTGVDSSLPALETAEKNAALNGRAIEWIEGNAFELLKEYSSDKRLYDTIVLDPPAFAKSKHDLDNAMRGYKELNLRAIKMLRPGGILVTCSCSFHVSAPMFTEMVADASGDAHRSARILESRTQSRDHPILLGVPESGYLKCLILSVS